MMIAMFSKTNALRDVNSVNCLKLEYEIEKFKKLEFSFALGFALHIRVVDELILMKNVWEKIQSCFFARSLFNVLSAKRVKQHKDVLVSQNCSKCFFE